MSQKEYLGDSVYAKKDEYGDVVLTTENGFSNDPSNVIYLDQYVIKRLLEFLKR